MSTTQQELKVGDVVTVPDGTRVTVIAVAGDIAECAWFDDAGHAEAGTFAVADLTVELPAAEATAPASEAAPGSSSLGLLVGFVDWLATRDEQVGPFSRNHLVDRAQASRVAAEYLAAQA